MQYLTAGFETNSSIYFLSVEILMSWNSYCCLGKWLNS